MLTDDRMRETPAERYLFDEFRAINAHVPRRRKSLADLLEEKPPHIMCGDGSAHFFKKKELALLAGMLDREESNDLMLPMIIEVSSGESAMAIPSPKGIEARVLSNILGMKLSLTGGRVLIFKAQLGRIRTILKTCTQYVFIP
ncbi:MAG: DUF61 family protein [Syntrophales bacterium]|jgi:uncharacterized protein (UPF0216 family)|nr:DUF61 family protein [Syntrophales bacterium]MCK9527734.1 DUF61 family protein [Syntrophales bacterium]MDX9921611.1 DUF61 family protein [Syntrophales bacterium]